MVNQKSRLVNSYTVHVGSGFLGLVTDWAVEPLTSYNDMSMTWTRANVDVLAGLLMWIDDVIIWRQMTSVGFFWRVVGAWDNHCRVQENPEISRRVEARVSAVESQISSIGISAIDMANGWAAHEEIVAAHRRKSQGLCLHVEACMIAYGCWNSRFFSREADKHVCIVGFVKRRLDLHRFDRERHRLLGLKDLDTPMSMAAAWCCEV